MPSLRTESLKTCQNALSCCGRVCVLACHGLPLLAQPCEFWSPLLRFKNTVAQRGGHMSDEMHSESESALFASSASSEEHCSEGPRFCMCSICQMRRAHRIFHAPDE